MNVFDALPSRVAMPHNGAHQQIEGRPRVMDDIADDGRQMFRDTMVDLELPDSLASLSVILDDHCVRVRGLERFNFGSKFPDVGFGPFGL
jgi:hypothetical protein